VRSLDVAVILAYFAAVIVFGLALAGRQRDASDYFLGHRGLPWWALMFSVVATETSALTVISVPGLAARGNLTFLQIAFGYLLGRIGVARCSCPATSRAPGHGVSAARASVRAARRRTASGVFLLTRALADCVRIFATAIRWPSSRTGACRWDRGHRVRHAGLHVGRRTPRGRVGGCHSARRLSARRHRNVDRRYTQRRRCRRLRRAWDAGKLTAFDFSFSLTKTYTFWGGLIGGALLSAASHAPII